MKTGYLEWIEIGLMRGYIRPRLPTYKEDCQPFKHYASKIIAKKHLRNRPGAITKCAICKRWKIET